ncbi:hypothetical protein [Parendozoicomonas haliclonae]|uniref:Penicillin-binding protein activator LpoB n=1 Tax=Parendozoicomonas haliclonae TaxID=1960125 RepID=A0A1X7AJN8_9GAMM|nr:hypothetical protein [Parendozoicomonas haliclonae]SMA45847.1 hypothetical protein EHSB41UT_02008 [Parendozoicomonas haliclonae]
MNKFYNLILLVFISVLAGCSSIPYEDGYPKENRWAVLPVQSLQSPDIGVQTERMLKVLLASRGIAHVALPPETELQGDNALLQGAQRLSNAESWAQQHNIQLGMTGVIDFVKTDSRDRFLIGITLQVIDIKTGEHLWAVSGQGEGKPGEDRYTVTRNLLTALLNGLPLKQ